jgi:hypothetical protein
MRKPAPPHRDPAGAYADAYHRCKRCKGSGCICCGQTGRRGPDTWDTQAHVKGDGLPDDPSGWFDA